MSANVNSSWTSLKIHDEMQKAVQELKANIIVATPGRMVDMLERKDDNFSFSTCVKSLEVLVLDEADRLLDMGFEKRLLKNMTVISIHGKMKGKRQKIFNRFMKMENDLCFLTEQGSHGLALNWIQWLVPSCASLHLFFLIFLSSFIHRCGRTARMGNEGSAVLLLMPRSALIHAFVNTNTLGEKKGMPSKVSKFYFSRAIYEKGVRAFVSYIKAYSKHECYLLFRMKDLDFGKVAQGFALLKMPYMPELRGKKIEGFQPSGVDVKAIPYKGNSHYDIIIIMCTVLFCEELLQQQKQT
ncbi:hypothetical protein HPB48_001368 [Haemaphysalis longicornis]|uniref:ATP-dependent RNA helicase n=1 Tax=Haemaphysalis longicornis TaxID=44386 RepID=A0A9J6FER3_HAELO|nr:hypothetical protein HPB48_001368 [Haemaphysalis longicornis]